MGEFIFSDDDQFLPGDGALVVSVPNASSKSEILSWYASNLSFPDYFGHNWDAFEECIRDLSWLPHRRLCLRHVELPLQPVPADLITYLAILSDAVRYWRDDGSRDLSVLFASGLRPKVESAIFRN